MTAFLALVANSGDGTISSFRIEEDRLRPLGVTKGLDGCSAFAVDASRDLVHAAVKQPHTGIVTLRLDRASGELTEVSRVETDGSMTYLSLVPDGTVLLGASYEGGFGQAWPLDPDRTALGGPGSQVHHANLHCVVPADDGRRACFVSLGDDLIATYDVEGTELAHPRTAAAPAGAGPRHLTFNSDESMAYVVTEFTGEVLRYRRDVTTGELTLEQQFSIVDPAAGLATSSYGADPRADHLIWGADVHVAPDDSVLWASERGVSTLATVPLRDGVLTEVTSLQGTESQPRGFNMTPDGHYLVVVGELSTAASLYRVEDGGIPVRIEQQFTGAKANWVRFVEL